MMFPMMFPGMFERLKAAAKMPSPYRTGPGVKTSFAAHKAARRGRVYNVGHCSGVQECDRRRRRAQP